MKDKDIVLTQEGILQWDERDALDGNIYVDEYLVFKGITRGSIFVRSKGVLHLHGICSGSLHVHMGGIAIVYGLVKRNVVNNGIVEVRGVVSGDVFTKDGYFHRMPAGRVQGEVTQDQDPK